MDSQSAINTKLISNQPKLQTQAHILQNPFHPLDLSAHDLLTIYKKFDISRETNRNPKHQLPIETIAQLISSLKGCKPSYIQKCMSQALIKDSINWNQFLAFLDQESQVRSKVFDWLIHQKSIVKFKFECEVGLKTKIGFEYEIISDIEYLTLNEDQLILMTLDNKVLVLMQVIDGTLKKIDQIVHLNTKAQNNTNQVPSFHMKNNYSQVKHSINRSSTVRKGNQIKDKSSQSLINKSIMLRSSGNAFGEHGLSLSKNYDEEQQYFKKQRKNIHAIFSLFNELPLQESKRFAEIANQKISNRTLNVGHVNHMKDAYIGFISEKKIELSSDRKVEQKPIVRAKSILSSLQQQKNILSYNPYKTPRTSKGVQVCRDSFFASNPKKLTHQRKPKHYFLESSHSKYCKELGCMVIIYYNLQMCLFKVGRDYKNIRLQQHGITKIILEKDYKKNDVVEMIQFYHHSTTSKWFVLVLLRSQHKHEPQTNNQSYIRGYEVRTEQGKRKGDKKFVFANEKEDFSIELGKCQIIKMIVQTDFGLHLISHHGRYITYREDYFVQSKNQNGVCMSYWKKQFDEKFKGISVSLSCLTVSSELNKAILGTIKGTIIIYDLFSKQYKLSKVAHCAIIQVQIIEGRSFILCENQKIIIYDIFRFEEIQNLNVKNEEKLHEKIDSFVFQQGKIVCFGTCMRVFTQHVDQSLQQEQFKMQNTYTWRLKKLDKIKGHQSINTKTTNNFRKQRSNAELFVSSQNFFIVLTEIQQAIFYSISTLEVKFTAILDIPYDEKVMKITVSQNEKLLAVLLFSQTIYVFNIYTQQEILKQKSTPYQKYTSISFLDKKNQYLLAAGTQTGRIILIPLSPTPQKDLKTLQLHTSPITLLTLLPNILISASESNQLAIWQLPFNILKRQLKLKNITLPSDYITAKLGHTLQFVYLRTLHGNVLSLNILKNDIKIQNGQFKEYQCVSVYGQAGYLIGLLKGNVEIWGQFGDGWEKKRVMALESKKNRNEIVGVGIGANGGRAVIFTKNGMYIWVKGSEKMSKFKSFLESIQ